MWKGAGARKPGNCRGGANQGQGHRRLEGKDVYCGCGDLLPQLPRMNHNCIFCKSRERGECVCVPMCPGPLRGLCWDSRKKGAPWAAPGLPKPVLPPPKGSGLPQPFRLLSKWGSGHAPAPGVKGPRLSNPLLPHPQAIYSQLCCPLLAAGPCSPGATFLFCGDWWVPGVRTGAIC